MKRFRLIGVALLSVLALGAMAASSAQAETAPYFTISGTRLVAGKTHNFDAKTYSKGLTAGRFILSTPGLGLKIECSGFSTQKGVLLGSNVGEPGKDNEIGVFEGCKLKEGNGAPECELAASERGEPTTTITPGPLKSEQVENVASGTKGNQLLEEFFPASGNVFVTVFFRGTGCTLFRAEVEGAVAGENLLDNASEGRIELGQAPQQRGSWLLRFPEAAINEVWLISSGVGKITKTTLSFATLSSTLTGTTLVLLTSTRGEPEPNTLWSPLP